MHLCFITEEYPGLKYHGGIGAYTATLARAMAQVDVQVTVVTIDEKPKTWVESSGVQVVAVCSQSREDFQRDVARMVYALGVDIVEAPEWGAPALLVAKHGQVPLVTRLHTPLFQILKLRNGRHIYEDDEKRLVEERQQVILSHGVTCPTHVMARLANRHWGILSITVIPNPVSLADLNTPIRETFSLPHPYLLFFGRLEQRKGIFVLSHAIPNLLKLASNLKVVLCGADTRYEGASALEAIRRSARLEQHRVVYTGPLFGDHKCSILGRASIVLLPSLWENFAYAGLEAMAMGKAIIATKGSGFDEMIEHGRSGLLVPANDPEALVEAVRELLNDPGLAVQFGKQAQFSVRSRFSIDLLLPKFKQFYESVF